MQTEMRAIETKAGHLTLKDGKKAYTCLMNSVMRVTTTRLVPVQYSNDYDLRNSLPLLYR